MKADAVQFSLSGDQFLGKPYKDNNFDCQDFVEHMMKEVGININLKGANAWYRRMTWVGTPEECKKKFGSIPKGAILFIHAFDGGEVKRGYHDGRGNASHMGVKTGRTGKEMVAHAKEQGNTIADKYNFGNGAIHSSSTREHVATSAFADKTINGGWNCVGLSDLFTYGDKIDAILSGETSSSSDSASSTTNGGGETLMYIATVSGGKVEYPLNLRKEKSTSSALVDYVPQGSVVTVIDSGDKWCKMQWNGKTGYMLSEYVHASIGDTNSGDDSISAQPGDTVTLKLTYDQAVALLPIMEACVTQLVSSVGRG